MLLKEKKRMRLIRFIVTLVILSLLGLVLLLTRSVYVDLKFLGIPDPIDPDKQTYVIEYYIDNELYDTKNIVGGLVEDIPYINDGDYIFSGWYIKNKDGYYDKYPIGEKTRTNISLYGTYFTYEEVFELLCDNEDKTWKLNSTMYVKHVDEQYVVEYENRSAMGGTAQSAIYVYDIFTKNLELTYHFKQVNNYESISNYNVSYDNNLSNINNISLKHISTEGNLNSEIHMNVANVAIQEILDALKTMVQGYESDPTELIKLGRTAWQI